MVVSPLEKLGPGLAEWAINREAGPARLAVLVDPGADPEAIRNLLAEAGGFSIGQSSDRPAWAANLTPGQLWIVLASPLVNGVVRG